MRLHSLYLFSRTTIQGRGTIILSKSLLNLAGCCNILHNRNFAVETIEVECILGSIAFRNASGPGSGDIQVFNEMFVTCYVHSFVNSEISRPGMCNFNEYVLCAKDLISSKEVTLAEWERKAIVTVWFRVRILFLSQTWFEVLQFRVA